MKYFLGLPLLCIAFSTFAQSDNFYLDEVFPIDDQGTIRLLSDDADVTVVGENRNDVAVLIERTVKRTGFHTGNADFRVEVSIVDGDLTVTEHNRSSGFSMGYISEEYTIQIRAPKSVSLDFKGDDDDYNITFINGEIALDTDDSDIRISNCQTPKVDLRIDDGSVEIASLKGELKARMDDGDLRILNSRLSHVDFVGDDSYAYIETFLPDNGVYNLGGDDANFEFDVLGGGGEFSISHDDGRIRASDHFELTYDSDSKKEYRLPGGNCQVKFRGDDIGVRLNAQLAY